MFQSIGQLPDYTQGIDAALQQNAAKPRTGMFGGKGAAIGEAIVAALNGYLAGTGNPVGIAGLQAMNQRRLEKQRLQIENEQYQRKRQDTLADYIEKAKIDAQYNPKQPHYWEDNTGNLMALGPDGKPVQVYEDPNPWKLVPNGLGGVVPVNMRALMGGQQPQGPIGKLTPLDEGGPSLGGSGGFPY